ncbi:unnamed protein product [Vitrella brassicaformis CCMP3155]|uniref:Rad50/SbcC-type AAA domain-containing protein n=1 Tax=Vitrella brassicaformis (strain CCMP3155) TaxID=1169540 RepID=A0A0G4EIP1_VITBC|nr:unnamed protein product [Vitrella brassicaformis CCMP3155]|eukprot:CEL96873.1 unnamed protein product [Vitrella brassicaformis CCMP3155]
MPRVFLDLSDDVWHYIIGTRLMDYAEVMPLRSSCHTVLSLVDHGAQQALHRLTRLQDWAWLNLVHVSPLQRLLIEDTLRKRKLRLAELSLENCLCFFKERILFSPNLNVIRGGNGTGKTSIILTISTALQVMEDMPSFAVLRSGAQSGSITIRFAPAADMSGHRFSLSLTVQLTSTRPFLTRQLAVNLGQGATRLKRVANGSSLPQSVPLDRVVISTVDADIQKWLSLLGTDGWRNLIRHQWSTNIPRTFFGATQLINQSAPPPPPPPSLSPPSAPSSAPAPPPVPSLPLPPMRKGRMSDEALRCHRDHQSTQVASRNMEALNALVTSYRAKMQAQRDNSPSHKQPHADGVLRPHPPSPSSASASASSARPFSSLSLAERLKTGASPIAAGDAPLVPFMGSGLGPGDLGVAGIPSFKVSVEGEEEGGDGRGGAGGGRGGQHLRFEYRPSGGMRYRPVEYRTTAGSSPEMEVLLRILLYLNEADSPFLAFDELMGFNLEDACDAEARRNLHPLQRTFSDLLYLALLHCLARGRQIIWTTVRHERVIGAWLRRLAKDLKPLPTPPSTPPTDDKATSTRSLVPQMPMPFRPSPGLSLAVSLHGETGVGDESPVVLAKKLTDIVLKGDKGDERPSAAAAAAAGTAEGDKKDIGEDADAFMCTREMEVNMIELESRGYAAPHNPPPYSIKTARARFNQLLL